MKLSDPIAVRVLSEHSPMRKRAKGARELQRKIAEATKHALRLAAKTRMRR